MKTVGIIGGAGFIGSYITKIFLENESEVKVSVTDAKRPDKYQHLKKFAFADYLHVKEMDVTDKDALQAFVSGCEIVIHSGTPFILDVTDPQTQLFEPTVKGTENFLEVVKGTPGIEKVVFVASVAGYNTNFPLPRGGKDVLDTMDENDEKFTSTESHPYAQAKFIANQVVDKFIEENPSLPFEISSVSPVMVMGKSLSNRQDSTSGGLQFWFKNKIAPNPFLQMLYDNDVPFAIVDVEDVAEAVHKIATTPGLHGRNYLLSSETYKVSDVSRMLNNHEPKAPGVEVYKNTLASTELDIDFRPVKDTLYHYSSEPLPH